MKQRLVLRLKAEPGSVVRVLVTMNKRGYDPVSIVARRKADAVDLELELEEAKPLVQLTRALERLFDVESVQVDK